MRLPRLTHYTGLSMAKFKPKRAKAAPVGSNRAAIPCLLLVLAGIVLISLLFYFSLQSSAS